MREKTFVTSFLVFHKTHVNQNLSFSVADVPLSYFILVCNRSFSTGQMETGCVALGCTAQSELLGQCGGFKSYCKAM